MSVLSVRLFGKLSIDCGDDALEGVIPGKAKELLCYLLTHGQRPTARESLATILWDDCTTEHSKQYLRKALWQLQSALCRSGKVTGPVLLVDSHWVSVSPKADIWVDVTEFERACAVAQGPLGRADRSSLDTLETAINLYRGDLLEGWYQDWCLYDRERLQNICLVVLDKLVAYSEEHHEHEKGINFATRILRSDRAHEIAHQHLMRLRYLSGDRAGALRQYEQCAAILKEELGVQPSERTREIYQQIREDATSAAMPGTEPPSLLHGALKRLHEVKAALAALQNAVDETLFHVGQALKSSNRNPGTPDKDPS